MPFYRAEVVGSLLRPPYLRQARLDFAADRLSTAQFKRHEDRAVDEALALQESCGLDVMTDGELRRSGFVGPLTDYVEGFEALGLDRRRWHRLSDSAEVDLIVPVTVTGKLRRRRSLAAEEFTYARARTARPLKVTLPSPLMLALRYSPEFSADAYPDPFQLFADAVDILRAEVRELASLGCEYIQIDAPEIATLVDPATCRNVYAANGIDPQRMLGEGLDLIEAVADAPGVTFALHLCRGNNAGHWMSAGGYEAISQQVFRRLRRYAIYLLEYDSERAGGFAPLRDLPSDKRVVLGLVSTKHELLEDFASLARRVDEAARHFPFDQMALSTQCGFASVAAGNPLTPATQEAKLRLVSTTARRLWP
ncbi:MAG TPA: cobalamin-independent methionine synthase II family protein [Candidatus Binataceae bacterium]|nr:cobalamin-independent methionine synthase II family protein [Candidatus Binataceae bacterium]